MSGRLWRGRCRYLGDTMDTKEAWNTEPLAGAQLITAYAHGLLTGPVAGAFMRQSALGQGAELMAVQLMDTAETLAAEAYRRSVARCHPAASEEVKALFAQTNGRGLVQP